MRVCVLEGLRPCLWTRASLSPAPLVFVHVAAAAARGGERERVKGARFFFEGAIHSFHGYLELQQQRQQQQQKPRSPPRVFSL